MVKSLDDERCKVQRSGSGSGEVGSWKYQSELGKSEEGKVDFMGWVSVSGGRGVGGGPLKGRKGQLVVWVALARAKAKRTGLQCD